MRVTVYDADAYSEHDTVIGFRCRDEAGRTIQVQFPREQAETLLLALAIGQISQVEAPAGIIPRDDVASRVAD